MANWVAVLQISAPHNRPALNGFHPQPFLARAQVNWSHSAPFNRRWARSRQETASRPFAGHRSKDNFRLQAFLLAYNKAEQKLRSLGREVDAPIIQDDLTHNFKTQLRLQVTL